MANPRNYPGLNDNEADIPRATNAMRDAISSDVQSLADGGGVGGGTVPPSAPVTINVPANRDTWTPTGVLVTAGSATVLHATGLASASATGDLTGPGTGDGAHLNWVVATDSTLPPVDFADRNHYYAVRDVDDSVTGQIYLCFSARDHSVNRGSFDVTLTKYDDANNVSALACVNRARLDVLRDLGLISEPDARATADVALQAAVSDKKASNLFALDVANSNAPSLIQNVLANIYALVLTKAPRLFGGYSDAEKTTARANLGIVASSANAMIPYCGDGSDGALVVSAGQTFALDREYNWSSVLVKSGGVLVVGGYRLLCRGTVTIENGGKIHADATGGYAYTGGSIARCETGAAGSSTGNGLAGAALSNCLGGSGGAGGNGNDGTVATIGGAGGIANPPGAGAGSYRTLHALATNVLIISSSSYFRGGAGGGAPGGSGNNGFKTGTPGGAPGAIVCINAFQIINNGVISARGQDGTNRTGTGVTGGSGGGGGGAVIQNSAIAPTVATTGTIDVSGGLGASGQNGGTAGQNGSAGQIFNNVWS